MLIIGQWFVYCIHSGSFFRKSGEEVNFLKLYYLDKDSYEDSKDWKGYKIQNFDVLPQGFTLSDFVDGPGFYKVSYTPSLSRRGQVQPKLVSVEFVKSLDFPKSEGLLVLGVKRFEFTPENSTDLRRGLNIIKSVTVTIFKSHRCS